MFLIGSNSRCTAGADAVDALGEICVARVVAVRTEDVGVRDENVPLTEVLEAAATARTLSASGASSENMPSSALWERTAIVSRQR